MSDPAKSPAGPVPEGYKILRSLGPFDHLIGPVYYKKLGDGGFRYGFQADTQHSNINKVIHGGMLYSFADQFMGVSLAHAAKRHTTTISLKASYMAPGRPGDWIEGEVDITRVTRTLGFAQGRVYSGHRTLMTAEGVWKLFDPKPGG